MSLGPILAVGGAGFNSDTPTPGLDRFFLSLTGLARPRVCYVGTASGDSLLGLHRFLRSCMEQDCVPQCLELFRPPSHDLTDYVASMDAIWVGGGNTHNMLLLWRDWGLDDLLRRASENGKVLGGLSAGANCWFEACSTDSFGDGLATMAGLGWLPGSFCPHYDSEPARRPTLRNFLEFGSLPAGYAADEGVGLLFEGGDLARVVAGLPTGAAYRVSLRDGRFAEEPIIPDTL